MTNPGEVSMDGMGEEEIAALEAELAADETVLAGEEDTGIVDEETGIADDGAGFPEEETGIADEEEEMGIDEAAAGEVDQEELALAQALEDEHSDLIGDQERQDAVEGNLRLKRMLSRDEDEAPDAKKRKADTPKDIKIQQLLSRWVLVGNATIKHVLDTCTEEELDEIMKGKFVPDKFHARKSVGELLNQYCAELRERKLPLGNALDAVASFKFKHKLDFAGERKVRALKHKELRYVLDRYDGSSDLDTVIEEAKASDLEEEGLTAKAMPTAAGVSTYGRFTRLELIDPLADCAVFGDANLTFSIKLAKHRTALGHAGRVVATTFEEIETLRERYKEIDSSIATLEEHFAEVYHGVDCTRIAIDARFKNMEGSLGAVYYNFPHSGAIQGFFDSHPIVNWRHENLMRLFFRALRYFVKPGGIVKVSSNMGAVGVRYSYIVGSALENEFKHIETVPFLEWHLHRYGRSYGDKRDVYKRPDATNNQSYNAQAADRDMVYCFCYCPSGEQIPKQQVKKPPSLQTLKACTDGPFKNLAGTAKEKLAHSLHNRFITEVSGTHVG